MALCLATLGALWLVEILQNLKFIQNAPIIFQEDNKACVAYLNHNVHHTPNQNTSNKDTSIRGV